MDSQPIKPEGTNDFFVVRTPWHSLIVHRVVKGTLIGDYKIEAGPFSDHFTAGEALVKMLSTVEDAEANARMSPQHIAYPHYDTSKGPEPKKTE